MKKLTTPKIYVRAHFVDYPYWSFEYKPDMDAEVERTDFLRHSQAMSKLKWRGFGRVFIDYDLIKEKHT